MFERVKGTQDFLDLTLFNFVVDQSKKHFINHHFVEIAPPILEPTELFKRAVGLETDVVKKEMYVLDTGEDGDAICLRPEATASVVRMFVEHGIQTTPWNVFMWGPMFRHERPQKGRFRQFHQVNIESIGTASVAYDAWFIGMLESLFTRRLLIHNTHALKINFLGCQADRVAYKATLNTFLDSVFDKICGLCQTRKQSNILRVLDCKQETCRALYQNAPRMAENLCQPCATEWKQLQEHLELLSVAYSVDHMLVRGLDYYNKTVFEFVSGNLGAQSTFCGGGRYDQLVSMIGGKQDQPAIGAAFGIERLLLMLEPMKDTLPLEQLPPVIAVIPIEPAQHALALLIAQQLQQNNFCVELFLEGNSLKSMMRQANRIGARICLIIGQQEQEQQQVIVKHMTTGQETKIKQSELIQGKALDPRFFDVSK